jgi:hypothetical protein
VGEQKFAEGVEDLALRLLALRRIAGGGYSWHTDILPSIRQ